jgi:hypothetical protein
LAEIVQEYQLIATVDLVHLENKQTLISSVFAGANVKIQKPFLSTFFPKRQRCGSGMFITDTGSWLLSIPEATKRRGEKN